MKTLDITVTGLVQGVGYRPFVAEQAEQLQLIGQVKNVGGIVQISVTGEDEALNEFVERLNAFYPAGARVDQVQVEERKNSQRFEAFSIVRSHEGEETLTFVPADIATCSRCEAELKDPTNRRYGHPFISCVSCGPRFSIIENLPYDRDTITMGDFPMCEACAKEYTQKGNVRRHAQTIACPDCGPKLRLLEAGRSQELESKEALNRAIDLLLAGKIGAIKDIGGFHFALIPTHSEPAMHLREFKNRQRKPFAIMFPDVDAIREYCYVTETEKELLTTVARPIVLLKKKKDFCKEICGESDRIGAMLPCNPLQILLAEAVGPLVMTSGNRGGEPIITEDEDMLALMQQGGPDFVLTHDRRILTPLEDSILQVVQVGTTARVQMLRRGRGYVPEPISIARTLPEQCYVAGGDLKAVFALGKQNQVYLSSHFGDLDDYRCVKKREQSLEHMKQLLRIQPSMTAGDMHPAYVSAKDTKRRFYHHHAHILSVMAEHGLDGRESDKGILGIAYDGTGFGTDHSVWGGEFLLCKGEDFSRVGHLTAVDMAGSDEGAKNACLSLNAYLLVARDTGLISAEEYENAFHLVDESTQIDTLRQRQKQRAMFERMRENRMGVVKSSSMGRLFDAVSALLAIKDYNSYEGECAIALENMAHRALMAGEQPVLLRFPIYRDEDGIWVADSVQLLVDILQAKEKYSTSVLALSFHQALVNMTCEMVDIIGTNTIALSGGSFCNRILFSGCIAHLEEKGYQVYTNEKVPCGDGGLAMGQMYGLTFEK